MWGRIRNWSCGKVFICIAALSVLLQPGDGQNSLTCTGLDQFLANTNQSLAECSRDSACTMVTCNTLDDTFSASLTHSIVTLQPCTHPPSISLTVEGPIHNIFNGQLNASTGIYVTQISRVGVVLDVTLVISINNTVDTEIGLGSALQLTVVEPAGLPNPTSTMTVNGFTRIPLDIQSCVTQPPRETMPTLETTSSGSPSVVQSGGLVLRTLLLLVVLSWYHCLPSR